MKEKKKLYMALLVLAFCLVGAAFLLRNAGLPYRVNAALMGMTTTLSCVGVARRNRIENEDERNAALRNRSKALSGDVLQWSLIGLFWLSVGLDAPLWVTALTGVLFAAKSVLEAVLLCRFRKEM